MGVFSFATSVRQLLAVKNKKKTGRVRGWQSDAWEMYDLVPELRYLTNAIAGRMGQATLYIGQLSSDPSAAPVPTTDPVLLELFSHFGTPKALGQIVTRVGLNLAVAGEGYMVGVPRDIIDSDAAYDPDGLFENLEWFALSAHEVTSQQPGTLSMKIDGTTYKLLEEEVYLIPVRRPHPKDSSEVDSPTRSLLTTLRQSVKLSMFTNALMDSRLAGAGIDFMPQEAVDAARRSMGLADDDPSNPFVDAYIENASTAISDRSSAASFVPIVFTMPAEVIKAFRHEDYASGLDKEIQPLSDMNTRRMALGMDLPPEVLFGNSGSSHWSSWLTDESVVKTHIAQPLAIITNAVTNEFLHMAMRALGYSEDVIATHVVAFDVAHLTAKPNVSSDAKDLHQRGVISDVELRDTTGFSTSVETTPHEKVLAMVRQMPGLAVSPGIPYLLGQVEGLADGSLEASDEPIISEVTTVSGATGPDPLPTNVSDTDDSPRKQGEPPTEPGAARPGGTKTLGESK